MTPDMIITLVILLVAIIFFVTEWLRVDVVALGVVVALMIANIITVPEGLAGFSSTAVISIGALFIVGGAVFHTGLANVIAAQILRVAGASERRLMLVLMVSVAVLSAFISSTGVVALLLPAMVSLSKRLDLPPSKLLIPVAFSSLLGGTATLIGTPPNVIASEALQTGGYEALGFFSFAPLGVALIAVGTAFMLFVGTRLLPVRHPAISVQNVETPEQLFKIHNLPDNLFRLKVPSDSPLVGMTIEETHLREEHGVTVVRIIRQPKTNGRGSRNVLQRSADGSINHPGPLTEFRADDLLIVQGNGETVSKAATRFGANFITSAPVDTADVITGQTGIAEVIIRPRSELLGKTIRNSEFGSRYHVTVLAIKRTGADGVLPVEDTPLKFGDMLIVEGEWKDIFAMKRKRHDFIVMGEPEAAQMGAFARTARAPFALIILAGMVVLIASNMLDLATASLLAALAVVLTGCLTMDEAYESIDWKSLILIAGMLPMSTALETVGLVSVVADGLIDGLGAIGPTAVLAGLFLMGMVFTQVLSNTTTAVLLAPIALLTANEMGVRPEAFILAIAFSTSLAFATPVASPVNTLVMTAGNYKFSDYARAGLPLMAIGMLICVILLPILWGF